jgi:ABC-type amino acid transport substrate-binding protein
MDMKRIAACIVALSIATAVGAQQLAIGTMAGQDIYGPAIAKMLKEAGFDIKLTAYNKQPDLLAALGKGGIDGAFFLAQPIIAQVGGAIMVPSRLGFTDICAVATDPAVKVAAPADLRKYTVGIVKGHAGHVAVTRGMTVVEAASEVEQFRMLAAGKFQVAVTVAELAPIMAKVAGIKTYFLQTPPLLRTPTFFALAAKRADIKDKVAAVFKRWVDGGQWEQETAQFAR